MLKNVRERLALIPNTAFNASLEPTLAPFGTKALTQQGTRFKRGISCSCSAMHAWIDSGTRCCGPFFFSINEIH